MNQPSTPLDASQSASLSSRSPSSSSGSASRQPRPPFTTSLSDFALPSPRPASPSFPFHQTSRIATPIVTSATGYVLRPRSSLAKTVIVSSQEGGDGQGQGDSKASCKGVRASPSSASYRRNDFPCAGLGANDRRDRDGEDDFDSSQDDRRASMATKAWSSSGQSSSRNNGSQTSLSPGLSRATHWIRPSRDRQRSPASRRPLSPDSLDSPSQYFAKGGDGSQEDIDVDLDLDGMDMKMADGDEVSPVADPTPAPSAPINEVASLSAATGGSPPPPPPLPPPPPPLPPPPPPHLLRRRSSTESLAPTVVSSGRRISTAPPLLRVLSLLRDESRPIESEVASEAKLTRRLGYEAEATELRRERMREREASPFPTLDLSGDQLAAAAAAGRTLSRVPSANTGFPSSDFSLHMDDEDSASESRYYAAALDEDSLLDNVGFISDHTTSDSSDAVSPSIEAKTAAPSSRDSFANLSDSENATRSTRYAIPDEYRTDSHMDEVHKEDKGKTTDAGGQTSTPFSSAPFRAQTPPGHGPSHQHSRGASSHSSTNEPALSQPQHPSKVNSPSAASTPPPVLSTSAHKRVGSAWTDFRNSPSPASGTVTTPLEKRHHHRSQHGNTYRNKVDREGAVPKMSTSPKGNGGASGPSSVHAANVSELSGSSSSGLSLPSSARAKRKFGPEERFEPYAASVYKRRAASPLTGLSLPPSGLGNLSTMSTASLPSSGVVSILPTSAAAGGGTNAGSNVSVGAVPSSSSPHGASAHPYYRPVLSASKSPPLNPRESSGYFGRRSVGTANAPASRSMTSAIGMGVLSRSPTTRPSTPLVGVGALDGNGFSATSGAAPATYYSSSPPLVASSSQIYRSNGPPMPMPIVGLGLGAGGTLLGSSPKSSGSGPGYGSGGIGLSIAANSRDEFLESPLGSANGEMPPGGGIGGLSSSIATAGRRSRRGSPVATRKRGFPAMGELTPGAADRLVRGYFERDKARDGKVASSGVIGGGEGEEMEGGVERMML